MSISLTGDALKNILLNGVYVEKPVLKILGYRLIRDQCERKRYQIFVTDNSNYSSLVLLDYNDINSIETLQQFTKKFIVKIIGYNINDVTSKGKQKRVMVIKEMSVMTQHNSENRSTRRSIFSSSELTSNVPAKISNKVTGYLRPIKKLIPKQFGQTIKAKVTNKTSRNMKKSFSADIEDESGTIKIIGYGEETDKYFDLIQVNKTYYFVGVYVQLNENGTQLYFPKKEVIIIDAEESASKLDRFETYIYTQKEGYIASKNGINIFSCQGTVIDICTSDCPYRACFQCRKKVTKIKNDFQCPKCQKNENFVDKLRLEINIADFSWNLQKLSLFDEVVKDLLEVENTKDIRELVLENNSKYWKIFQKVLFKTYEFEIQANKNFNNPKFKTLNTFIITSVKKLNYKERCRQLLTEIKNMFTFWKAYVKYVNEQLGKEVFNKNLEMKFSALKL